MNLMTSGLLSSNSNSWETPREFFEKLDAIFHFTLDPCATPENAKCPKFYTEEDDGLLQDWGGERVFMNPPYGGETGKWVKKASMEARKPDTLVVGLIASRTDASYWYDYIFPCASELWFIKGRLKFSNSKTSAPFPSVIVVWDSNTDNNLKLKAIDKHGNFLYHIS